MITRGSVRLIVARALMEIGFAWLLGRWRPRAFGWWLTKAARTIAGHSLKD